MEMTIEIVSVAFGIPALLVGSVALMRRELRASATSTSQPSAPGSSPRWG